MATRLYLLFFYMALPAYPAVAHTLQIKQIIVQDARCYGQSTGSAEIVVTGGKPPYQYSLDGKRFQRETVFKQLKAGNYRVYLKDAENQLSTSTFTVYQPQKIHFSPAKTTNSGCCEPDGAVLVQAQGGTGTIQYQINDSPFQTSGYFSGLSGGYTVVAKDSLGCKAALVVKIDDFNGPIIDFMNSSEVSCHAGNNGSITIYAIGGSGRLSYSIDGGKNWQRDPQFNGLQAGTYLAKTKDETGCTDSTSIVISQPPALEIRATVMANENAYAGHTLQVEYSIGGTGNHTYSLNNGDYQSSGTFKNIAAGEHILYVKDIAGCTGQNRISIAAPLEGKRTTRHKAARHE